MVTDLCGEKGKSNPVEATFVASSREGVFTYGSTERIREHGSYADTGGIWESNRGDTGGFGTTPDLGLPQAYGAMPVGAVPTNGTPTASAFPANGTLGTPLAPGLQNLNSGFGTSEPSSVLQDLREAYGAGTGDMLAQMLTQGLFNPQVAQALIAAMQPNIERGLVGTEGAFAGEGARFSSSAQIGVGDYESQATLGENQILANMYQQDQAEQLQLLESVMPTLHQERADSGGGVLGDVLGGLEIAGGVAAAPFTGGLSLGLIPSGVKTITGANSSSNNASSSSGMGSIGGLGSIMQQAQLAQQQQATLAALVQQYGIGTTGVNGAGVTGVNSFATMFPEIQEWDQNSLSATAGSDLGVPYNTATPSTGQPDIQQLIQMLSQFPQ